MYCSIKRTVAKNSKMSLLNVPYIGKKVLRTVSINHTYAVTVAKNFKMSLLKVPPFIVIKGDFRFKIKYVVIMYCTIMASEATL